MILYTFTIDQCGNKTLHRFMKAHLPNQTTHEGGEKTTKIKTTKELDYKRNMTKSKGRKYY